MALVELVNFSWCSRLKIWQKWQQVLLKLVVVAVPVFYLNWLIINNLPWLTASNQAGEIVRGLGQVAAVVNTNGDNLASLNAVQIVVEGIPDKYKGAYVALNMFAFANNPGMVFYDLKPSVDWVYAGQPLPPSQILAPHAKVIYVAKFSIIQDHVQLLSVEYGKVAE